MSQSNTVLSRPTTPRQRDLLVMLAELAERIVDVESHDREGERVVRACALGHGRHLQIDIWPDGAIEWRVAR